MQPSPAVSLLLTNLRLLDYGDRSEESFPVTADVFTSLKNKGKAFEHIVYHLFRIHDAPECDLKLQACWPIYEPAQSREFRNVIFKWITELKRNGQLGGNILIRRTLLEDCCGERYEELLLALSTMALKVRIDEGAFDKVPRESFAYKQANSLTPSLQSLTPLIIAHQSSITRLLHSRRIAKSQWASFSNFLHSKESDLAALCEILSASPSNEPPKALPRGYKEEVLSKWRNNWLGDQRWLDLLLEGDDEFMRDRFLELPFKRALAKHHHFKNGMVVGRGGGVSLKALEKQVEEQKKRAGGLRRMREDLMRSASAVRRKSVSLERLEKEAPTEKKGFQVLFQEHQKLHLSQMKEIKTVTFAHDENEYTYLLESLRDELAITNAPRRRARERLDSSQSHYQREREREFEQDDQSDQDVEMYDADEAADLEDSLASIVIEQSPPESPIKSMPPSSPPLQKKTTKEYSPPRKSLVKISQQVEEFDPPHASSSANSDEDEDECEYDEDERFSFDTPRTSQTLDPIAALSSLSEVSQRQRKSQAGRLSLGLGDDELLAEQIVSSITGAAFSPEKPSPVKRKMPQFEYNQSPNDSSLSNPADFGFSSTGLNSFKSQSPSPKAIQASPQTDDCPNTPVRDDSPTSSTSSTPKEDLLISEDYNSVFKSRPKIALSPLLTPAAGGSPAKMPNMSLASSDTPALDYSEDEEGDINMEDYAASPLRQKNRDIKRL